MPIKIPNDLPAVDILTQENIFVMSETRAGNQDIRPLKILFLNLMPKKVETETQFSRLLGNTPLQVELELIRIKSHVSKNTSEEHLLSFYKTFDEVKNKKYDGMVITGAPLENLEYNEVEYWDELCEIFEWTKSHVHSTIHICWGAMAGLYYHYGINKINASKKIFGIYPQKVLYGKSMLMRGFDDYFNMPQSREAYLDEEAVKKCKDLQVMAYSEETGSCILKSENSRRIFVMGHPEYSTGTLSEEYYRDLGKGIDIAVPYNYFEDDNPRNKPKMTWRSHANLLYSNWLNYFVYQTTPYNMENICNE